MSQRFNMTPASGSTDTPLQNLATSPQRVRTDEGTVEERPIDQLLMADAYNRLDQQNQTRVSPTITPFGISIVSCRPPDALGKQRPDPWTPRML